MLHLFLGLKSLVKVSRFHTDCSVFRLHYRATVMVLLAFTFIVTSRQYIGAAIMCVHTEDIPKEVLNTYCWIHPTYTLSSAHWKRVGVDVPHPGVDKTRDERDKKHVKYYQWVGFCLFFQVGHIYSPFIRCPRCNKKLFSTETHLPPPGNTLQGKDISAGVMFFLGAIFVATEGGQWPVGISRRCKCPKAPPREHTARVLFHC